MQGGRQAKGHLWDPGGRRRCCAPGVWSGLKRYRDGHELEQRAAPCAVVLMNLQSFTNVINFILPAEDIQTAALHQRGCSEGCCNSCRVNSERSAHLADPAVPVRAKKLCRSRMQKYDKDVQCNSAEARACCAAAVASTISPSHASLKLVNPPDAPEGAPNQYAECG